MVMMLTLCQSLRVTVFREKMTYVKAKTYSSELVVYAAPVLDVRVLAAEWLLLYTVLVPHCASRLRSGTRPARRAPPTPLANHNPRRIVRCRCVSTAV